MLFHSFIMFIVSTHMIIWMYTENTGNCCEHTFKLYQSKSNYNDTNLFVMYRWIQRGPKNKECFTFIHTCVKTKNKYHVDNIKLRWQNTHYGKMAQLNINKYIKVRFLQPFCNPFSTYLQRFLQPMPHKMMYLIPFQEQKAITNLVFTMLWHL